MTAGTAYDTMTAFTYLFLALLALSVLLQLWLATRNMHHVRAHRDRVPEPFDQKIPLQSHQKAADYTMARSRLGRWDTVYEALILVAWTLGGGLEAIDSLWRGFGLGPVATGVGVIVSVMLIAAALEIPFSLYRTFGIEQRFGFNRLTPRLFVTDLFKSAVLMIVIGAPLLSLALWLMAITGRWWWLYVWGLWLGFTLLMMWAYPTWIAPLFNRFEPLSDTALRERVENLLQRCGFKSSGVFVMDGSKRSAHGNAFFGGVGSNKRIVFFDTLIKQLDGEEIEAVLAHELGHFRLHHIRKRIVGMAVASLLGLALLAWLMQQPWFYVSLGVSTPSNYMGLMLFMLLAPVFGFLLTPALSWLSRRHEFQADDFAAHQSSAAILARALVKLYRENASTLTPDPLYSQFFDSHPPAPIRVRHLLGQT